MKYHLTKINQIASKSSNKLHFKELERQLRVKEKQNQKLLTKDRDDTNEIANLQKQLDEAWKKNHELEQENEKVRRFY